MLCSKLWCDNRQDHDKANLLQIQKWYHILYHTTRGYIVFISPSLSATQEYTPDPVLTMTMIWFLLSHQNRYIACFDLDLKEFMWFVWAEVLHLSSWLIVKLSHRRRLLIWRENIKRFLKRILNLLNLIKYFPSSKKYSFSSRSQQW